MSKNAMCFDVSRHMKKQQQINKHASCILTNLGHHTMPIMLSTQAEPSSRRKLFPFFAFLAKTQIIFIFLFIFVHINSHSTYLLDIPPH